MIASAYGVSFRNEPYFLTDAHLHEGTSGSPVITKPKSTWAVEGGGSVLKTNVSYFLVGVHSGAIVWGEDESLGLGAAWYAQLIEEIASSFE